jgi:hypothetical protein
MPKVYNNYNNTAQITRYDDESELPRNIKIFIKELRSKLGDNLKFDEYSVSKSLLSPGDEDYDPDDNNDDLDLDYFVDAEAYAKGETPYGSRRDINNEFDYLADGLGIKVWTTYTKIVNKKEFADKFLKDLKKYMKSTEYGDYIHAIKFNVNNTHDLEVVFVLKRDFWSRYSYVRDAARYYLDSLGYNKVSIHVP